VEDAREVFAVDLDEPTTSLRFEIVGNTLDIFACRPGDVEQQETGQAKQHVTRLQPIKRLQLDAVDLDQVLLRIKDIARIKSGADVSVEPDEPGTATSQTSMEDQCFEWQLEPV
jgi:hypothetical protein